MGILSLSSLSINRALRKKLEGLNLKTVFPLRPFLSSTFSSITFFGKPLFKKADELVFVDCVYI